MDQMTLSKLTKTAIAGASLLSGKRGTYALLANLLGVTRSQPVRWAIGDTNPRKESLRGLKELARLSRVIDREKERTRKVLASLKK